MTFLSFYYYFLACRQGTGMLAALTNSKGDQQLLKNKGQWSISTTTNTDITYSNKIIGQTNRTKETIMLYIITLLLFIFTTFQNRTWVFQNKIRKQYDNSGIVHFLVLLADMASVYFDINNATYMTARENVSID